MIKASVALEKFASLKPVLLPIGVVFCAGCSLLQPESFDPAEFDSRDYYALEQDETVLGLSGISSGYTSPWPVFGAVSTYGASPYDYEFEGNTSWLSAFAGLPGNGLNTHSNRFAFYPGFSNYPIPPTVPNGFEPGRGVPTAHIPPGSIARHFGEDGRIGRQPGSTRSGARTSTRYRSLSRSYSRVGGGGGRPGPHGRGGRRGGGRVTR